MPITLSDKRKATIFMTIEEQLNDLRLNLVRAGLVFGFSQTDLLIRAAVPKLYAAVLAAAEGRKQP